MKNFIICLLVILGGFVASLFVSPELKGQSVSDVLKTREKNKNNVQSAAKTAEESFRNQLVPIKTPANVDLTWLDAAKENKQQLFNALEEMSKLAAKMPDKDSDVINLRAAITSQKVKSQNLFDSLAVAVNAADSLTYINIQLDTDARSFENKLLKLSLVRNKEELETTKKELQFYMNLMLDLQMRKSSFVGKISKVSRIKISLSNQTAQSLADLDGVKAMDLDFNPKKKTKK